MTKKKETLPKGVLAQDEYTEEKEEEQIITQVSLHIDFKVRNLSCTPEQIVKDATTKIVDAFYDCTWVRAQVLEYKEV